jgi:hypothetical protein
MEEKAVVALILSRSIHISSQPVYAIPSLPLQSGQANAIFARLLQAGLPMALCLFNHIARERATHP